MNDVSKAGAHAGMHRHLRLRTAFRRGPQRARAVADRAV